MSMLWWRATYCCSTNCVTLKSSLIGNDALFFSRLYSYLYNIKASYRNPREGENDLLGMQEMSSAKAVVL